MYATDEANRFLEVTYQNGDKEILFFKDFSSGAMIENIVRRAKKLAIKRTIAGGETRDRDPGPARLHQAGVPRARGSAEHDQSRRLGEDLRQEGRAHRFRPDAAHQGRRGHGGRQIERVTTGQYLRLRVPPPCAGVAVPKVCGIETEYGVVLRNAADPNPVLASSTAHQRLCRAPPHRLGLRRRDPGRDARGYGREGSQPPQVETHLVNTVLTNGARYYVDHAHPEYSTPECADALKVAADKSGERVLARSMPRRPSPAGAGPGDRRLQEQLRR